MLFSLILLVLLTIVAYGGAVSTPRYRKHRAWVPLLGFAAASACFLIIVFTGGGPLGWQDSVIGMLSGVGQSAHDACGGSWSWLGGLFEVIFLIGAIIGPWAGIFLGIVGTLLELRSKDGWWLKAGIYIFTVSVAAMILSGLMFFFMHAANMCHVVR